MTDTEPQLERRLDADWKLIRMYVKAGSEAAFDALVRRYFRFVYSVCVRETRSAAMAEDATQAVFIVLARKLTSFRRPVTLSSWLFMVARLVSRNAVRDHRRRAAREAGVAMAISGDLRDQLSERSEVATHLNAALAKLKATERDAIVMRFCEELTFPEMAVALGISADAARVRVNRAVEKLRCCMQSAGVTAAVLVDSLSRAQPTPDLMFHKTMTSIRASQSASSQVKLLANGALRKMTMTKFVAISISAVLCFLGVQLIRASATTPIHRVVAMKPVVANADFLRPLPSVPLTLELGKIVAAQQRYERELLSARYHTSIHFVRTDAFYELALRRLATSSPSVSVDQLRALNPPVTDVEEDSIVDRTRYYCRSSTTTELNKQTSHVAVCFDGAKSTVMYDYLRKGINRTTGKDDIEPAKRFGYIVEGQVSPTMFDAQNPLNFGYQIYRNQAEQVWIADLLTNGNPNIVRTGTDPTFGKLIVVDVHASGLRDRPTEYMFWFAPKFGYIAVRTEETAQGWHNANETLRVQQRGHYWIADRGRHLMYQDDDGKPVVVQTLEMTYRDVAINDVSDASFRIAPDPNTTMYDHMQNRLIVTDDAARIVKSDPIPPGANEPEDWQPEVRIGK